MLDPAMPAQRERGEDALGRKLAAGILVGETISWVLRAGAGSLMVPPELSQNVPATSAGLRVKQCSARSRAARTRDRRVIIAICTIAIRSDAS